MAVFQGFSTDNLVPLPVEFFTQIVPGIKDPAELKVTLHVFYALSRKRGRNRRVSWDDLADDEVLRQSLQALSAHRPSAQLLEEGLAAAVRRGTLLHLVSFEEGRACNWYLVNTPGNRGWVSRHTSAGVEPSPADSADRPSIFTLYEENIGVLTPLLAEELREAASRYPRLWIEDAMREAIRSNARNWRYICRVLERWEADGKTSPQDRSERSVDLSKYTTGKYAHLFQRGGDDGSSGLSDL